VDDILVTSRSQHEIDKFGVYLVSKFETKDLGPIKYCLAIEFTVGKDGIKTTSTRLRA